MGPGPGNLPGLSAHGISCRFVLRREKGTAEVLQFITSGLEIGQQVVALAGPTYLKDLARTLGQMGLRPECLLRNGRLVFLTAPNCVTQLTNPGDPLQRGPLHRNGSLLRWLTDWSWAYTGKMDPGTILDYQRRIHEFIRSVTTLSLCTVHCEKLERGTLLAMLADHRRAFRGATGPAGL
jgi:DcmR-like sensory protein